MYFRDISEYMLTVLLSLRRKCHALHRLDTATRQKFIIRGFTDGFDGNTERF